MQRHSIQIVMAAIVEGGSLLVAQRGAGMSFPGRWELPGGKVEPNEHPRQALRREVHEELELDVEVGPVLFEGSCQPDERCFEVVVFETVVVGGTLRAAEHARTAWVGAEDVPSLPWSEPARPTLASLRARLDRVPAVSPADAAMAWSVISASWINAVAVAWSGAGLATMRALSVPWAATRPSAD